MTQEEKAKSYDEALEKAKEHINSKGIGDTVDLCKHLFPQLQESEDERMMKNIRLAILSVDDAFWRTHGFTAKEAISYLEKQKEQKHPNGCFTCDEYKKGYEEGRRNGFTAGYNKAMKEVEQKEQKPAENDCQFIDEKFMETDFWKQYVKDSIIPGNKPTQQDIDFLLPQAENLFALATKDMCNGCKDWSRGYNAGFANAEKAEREKSVIVTKQEYDSHSIVTRDAVSVKPAEWSEEDEDYMNAIIAIINRETALYPKGGATEDLNNDLIAWLKSLHPSWKPSEEQIRSLEYFIELWGDSDGQLKYAKIFNDVKSLCEQLKNL